MLECTSLRKRYGNHVAVDGIGFRVAAGRIVGLVGNNGAGKTTTIKMVCGILAPDSGAVRIGGADPRDAHIRHQVGFLSEESALYEDQTPVQYLSFFAALYALGPSRPRIEELLASLRLDEVHWHRPIGQLSKGSVRKVAVARALLHDPDVLVLDEPASGLDPATRQELDALLVRLRASGKAILLSAHDLEQVERLCDEVVLVHQGRVVAQGALDELREAWGGWTYHVHATIPFAGSLPRGPGHVAAYAGVQEAEEAMASVRRAGGTVLQMESRPPRLDEILRRAAEA